MRGDDLFAERRARSPWVSKKGLAAALGVSPRTIEVWVADHRIPCRKFSERLVRFHLPRVQKAITAEKVASQFTKEEPAVEAPRARGKEWVGKWVVAGTYDIAHRTVEGWMATGVIPYRKTATGGVRLDLQAVERALEVFDRPGSRK